MKGARKFGVRIGNWLTAEQGMRLLEVFDRRSLRGLRDYAMLAVLLGCGLRRAELAALSLHDLQQREEHWVFADLIGKGQPVRTVPVPFWIETALRAWISEAKITDCPILRGINKAGRIAPHEFSPKVSGAWCRTHAQGAVSPVWLLMTCAARARVYATTPAGSWSRFSSCSGTSVFKRPSDTWPVSSGSEMPSTILRDRTQPDATRLMPADLSGLIRPNLRVADHLLGTADSM